MSADEDPGRLTIGRVALLLVGLVVLLTLSYTRLGQAPGASHGRLITRTGETMGTTYSVKVVADRRMEISGHEIELIVCNVLQFINQLMSTYHPGTELCRFNTWDSTEPFAVSPQVAEVFAAAAMVSEQSGGAFDVTVGPIVNAYGFGPEARVSLPTDEELEVLRERVGYEKVVVDVAAGTLRKTRPDIYCDLSAIAKGYAVDAVANALKKRGLVNYFVEIGGEIRARGRNQRGETWTVGIEQPLDDARAVRRAIPLKNRAMATSGDYRNFYEVDGVRISHTIDARTGRPVDHALASVTVVDRTCMMADAYATAMMVLGPEDGYLMAEILELPVLFLIRGDDGAITERATPAFEEAFGVHMTQTD